MFSTFQAVNSRLLKLFITAMINRIYISFFAVQIYCLSYIHMHFSSTSILRTHNADATYQLSVGWIAKDAFKICIS